MSNNLNHLPLLVLKDMVILPGVVSHILLTTERSNNALSEVQKLGQQEILLVTETLSDKDSESITVSKLPSIGVKAKILQILHLDDQESKKVKILIEAESRVKLNIKDNSSNFLSANYEILHDNSLKNLIEKSDDINELFVLFSEYAKMKSLNLESMKDFSIFKNPGYLSNIIA
jgi:ATP-dependent Lon protease